MYFHSKLQLLLLIYLLVNSRAAVSQKLENYSEYHQRIIRAEVLLTDERYQESLNVFDSVFEDYKYVFVRDYKVAAQVAVYVGDQQKAFRYLKAGIVAGCSLLEINNNRLFKGLRQAPEWMLLLKSYDSLHNLYADRLDYPVRYAVRDMFMHDQKLARVNARISDERTQERFLIKKFAPQSEKHMRRLIDILERQGYPGEKLIGNNEWAWTLLSHHNSISPDYNNNDTLYSYLRPLLLNAISAGELSPYDFAIIEEWRITVTSNHKDKSYGYLDTLSQADLVTSNKLRHNIGMRSVETTNKLVDIQQKTGIDFYLEGSMWIKGKIPITSRD